MSGESRVDGLEQPPIEGDYVALRDLEWKSLEDRRMRWGLGMLLHTQREGDYVGLTQLPGLVQQLTLSSKRVPDGNAFNRGVSDLNYRCHRAQTWKTWKSSSNEASCVRRLGDSIYSQEIRLKKRSHHFLELKNSRSARTISRLGDLEMLTG